MKVIIRQVEVSLEYNDAEILQAVALRLKCDKSFIKGCEVVRRSLDTRPRRSAPAYILSVEVLLGNGLKQWPKNDKDIEACKDEPAMPVPVKISFSDKHERPVVVGAGPAGLMAAFHLAMMGCRPILIERGARAEERRAIVDDFWRLGTFLPENNVLYGEGGAGLFSDGKLTARSKDRPRIRLFFETLVRCGASRDILIDSDPHLGSDVLQKIVPNLRRLIEENGGETRYNTTLTDIFSENGKINGIKAGDKEIRTNHLLLATGHSARDVYHLLGERGASLQAKPFAAGIRLEIPQKQINIGQYGKFLGNGHLKAASFKLTRRPEANARACYSFCMCPGGLVITCASEAGAFTTNGMSFSGRDSIWGNAAFIVPIEPTDYAGFAGPETHPELAGINYQLAMEKAAFVAGGKGFSAPALMLNDFLANRISEELPANRSCPRSIAADFNQIFPSFIIETLRHAMPPMLRELNGADPSSAIVYAAETRSSSPVRVVRGDDGQSPALAGLFPAGEGAGYAGGIVSSAVDGLKAAELLLESMKQ